MPRKKLIRSSVHPYHVSSRVNNKDWFYIPIDDVWNLCKKFLNQGSQDFKVQIDAFTLMSNHYHICLKTPEANIDKFMQFFNQSLAYEINKESQRVNRIFGSRYKWNLISSNAYYWNVIRYIYQNPLRAGLVEKCEDYPFSDIASQKQKYSHEVLSWFNQTISKYEVDRTRARLKSYFID